MVKKVFVSQPMRGKSREEIEAERDMALDMAEEIIGECREVPSYFGPSANEQMRPLERLGKSIELMAFADVAVFAPGWRDARGCNIEHLCAESYGVQIIELDEL